MFNENNNKIKAIMIKNTGCWNCIPHPTLTPKTRKKIKIAAKKTNEDIIPNEVIKKLFPIDFLSFEDLRNDRIFIDKTGKTHGIKFNIIPPSKLMINI